MIVLVRIQRVKAVKIIWMIVLTLDNPGIASNQAAYLKTQEGDKDLQMHPLGDRLEGALLLCPSPARMW